MTGLLVNSLGRIKHNPLCPIQPVINMVMTVFREKAVPVRIISTIVTIKKSARSCFSCF